VEGHGFSHAEKRHREVGGQAGELSHPQRLKADFFFACFYGTPERRALSNKPHLYSKHSNRFA
jgi:hypothetical protein